MAIDNPLGPDGLERLRAAEEKLVEARKQIERAKLAGINVVELETRAREELDRVRKLKAAYYPNG